MVAGDGHNVTDYEAFAVNDDDGDLTSGLTLHYW